MATVTDQKVEDFYLGKAEIPLDESTFDALIAYVNAQEKNILRMMRDVDGYSQYSEMVHESNTHDVFRALINEERAKVEVPSEGFVFWVRHNLRSIQRMAYVVWSLWHIGRPANTVPLTVRVLTVAVLTGQQNYLRSKSVEEVQD